MEVLIKVGQLLLSLSILIVLHEMGHFFPARWFKTRVEKFFLFFDAPPFNSLWSVKRGETEYGIGWLPLGGYVKISGMVDESMDTDFKNRTPEPWEFRSKKAWQRLIIMLGGVTVNFLLGFFIFAMLLWAYGREYIPTSEMKYGTAFDSVLVRQGFRDGDVITRIGNRAFDRFDPDAFLKQVVFGDERRVTVRRDERDTTLVMPDDIARQVTDMGVPKSALLLQRFPFFIDRTAPNSPAEKAGIAKGDRLIAFDQTPTLYYDQFVRMCQSHKGQPATIAVLRGTDTLRYPLTLTEDGTIGVQASKEGLFKTERQKYGFFESFPAGYREGVEFLGTQINAFGKMISGKISANKNLGSFISIGNMFPSEFSWERFWYLTATLSLILAFMNLLPIPALDGGYVMFLIWEVVTGRKVSDNVMEKAVTAGFFLLMGLMLYAFGLDIWRYVISKFIG